MLSILLLTPALLCSQPSGNTWTHLEQAAIPQRWDIPLAFAPEQKQFLVLGGRTTLANYKKARPYDVLALDLKKNQWENQFPPGKDWGPLTGASKAPGWKSENFGMLDSEGNIRPNWTVYGTFSLGQKYDYDPHTKAFYFYAGGRTFSYDPAQRTWKDLNPATHPEKELGGILLWSSMCYDQDNKRFVLFGGGNVQSQRGDPGTWTYSPKDNVWTQLNLERQPPARANSRLVYDPLHKKIVLFGGDQLHQLVADTWVFDVATSTWSEQKPSRSPLPRAGQAMLWLPQAKKILLLGGYTYTSTVGYVSSLYQALPLEAWTYDVATQQWDLVGRWEDGKKKPLSMANFFLSAAVDERDRIVLLGQNGVWLGQVDASQIDAAGTKKFSSPPGATVRRTGPHDPAWYQEGVPAADPEKVAADLKNLPANRWVLRPTLKLAAPNMDWGSAVFAPELDKILRFSGGHSAYSGTAPQVYDVKTDRYSIPFAPEYPIEYVYSNDQVNGEWSFQGNPWMTGHTYKSTGYDPNLKSLVFAPHDYTYFFDPLKGKWSRTTRKNPYRADFYNVTVCATPQGAVVWADKREGGGQGLWRMDAAEKSWQPLPLATALHAKSPDHHGLAYDAQRDRLLFFSDVGKDKGDVAEYDLKTKKARWLNPIGKEQALAQCRETAYVPELDMVMIGARLPGAKGELLWLFYDCAKNAWRAAALTGADPIGKGRFNNSMGLMHDPNRGLIWAVGQNSHVHVLRLDPKGLDFQDLK